MNGGHLQFKAITVPNRFLIFTNHKLFDITNLVTTRRIFGMDNFEVSKEVRAIHKKIHEEPIIYSREDWLEYLDKMRKDLKSAKVA